MIRGEGPIPARVMLVGEHPTSDDLARNSPFSGSVGYELNKMLQESGILRSECFSTHVCRVGVPFREGIDIHIAKTKKEITKSHILLHDKYVTPIFYEGFETLRKEISLVRPNIILAFGNAACFALTGRWGVTKHRGSMLYADTKYFPSNTKVIPTITAQVVQREWSWRALCVNDIKRAARFRDGSDYPQPDWKFVIAPSYGEAIAILHSLSRPQEPTWLDFDYETKASHIDCVGISWSKQHAICIPFMSNKDKAGYWSLEEEASLVYHIYKVLTHPLNYIRGQNLLYDCQYSYRWWHFLPNVKQDCMVSQHVAFAGMKKSLDFQASLYCDYFVQWKPDRSSWKEGG